MRDEMAPDMGMKKEEFARGRHFIQTWATHTPSNISHSTPQIWQENPPETGHCAFLYDSFSRHYLRPRKPIDLM
jgi:hypothetical protein